MGWNALIAYWTPCTYAPDDCASWQLGMLKLLPVFVTRFGSESGSMTNAKRRLTYFGFLKMPAMTSMYCVLYVVKPSNGCVGGLAAILSSPFDARAAQSRPGRS